MSELRTFLPEPSTGIPMPRLALGAGPTRVSRIDALGIPHGPDVWIKDDGTYGRFGGNKARKLEWLLADARAHGRRTVLTSGAIATNHGLATALYARDLGMKAVLVLVPQPVDDHVRRQLSLIRASGAEIHFAGSPTVATALSAALLARRPPRGERRPHLILPGGSSPLGCIGYALAGLELGRQVAAGMLPEPAHVVVALGSGGTAAGLALGLRLAGLRSRLHPILVNDLTPMGAGAVTRLARRTQALLRRRGATLPQVLIDPAAIKVHTEWLGAGYGHSSAAGAAASERFAAAGIELEPVYTAKAAAALLALAVRGDLGHGSVLFWNTHDSRGPAMSNL